MSFVFDLCLDEVKLRHSASVGDRTFDVVIGTGEGLKPASIVLGQ